MTGDLPGDPASCSSLGGALRTRAAYLRDEAGASREASRALQQGWPGRTGMSLRRTVDACTGEALDLAGVLDRAGQVLQEHAADLASDQQQVREVQTRARALGAGVVDLRVVPDAGPRRVGTAEQEGQRQGELVELQQVLDAVWRRAARRQAQLGRTLRGLGEDGLPGQR